jgi:hypothetical protein
MKRISSNKKKRVSLEERVIALLVFTICAGLLVFGIPALTVAADNAAVHKTSEKAGGNGKYGYCFRDNTSPGKPVWDPNVLAYIDKNVVGEANFFLATYMMPDSIPPFHGPHQHPNGEFLAYFGTDPKNPTDLGGQITIYMGEEMEKHTFTKSTLVFIPAGVVHCPIVYDRIDRPILFVYTMPVGELQEMSRKDLLPKVPAELRDKLIFPHDPDFKPPKGMSQPTK